VTFALGTLAFFIVGALQTQHTQVASGWTGSLFVYWLLVIGSTCIFALALFELRRSSVANWRVAGGHASNTPRTVCVFLAVAVSVLMSVAAVFVLSPDARLQAALLSYMVFCATFYLFSVYAVGKDLREYVQDRYPMLLREFDAEPTDCLCL
jgi:Ca2+/Na+ antiporter